jgi:hypothetical protein
VQLIADVDPVTSGDQPGFNVQVEDTRCGTFNAVTDTPNGSRPSGTND